LDDHRVLASVGSVGDAYDNALAESFVDSYKTELIADRVWCSRAQLELATVEWVGWFNHDRLHESLGDIPPVEFEQLRALEGPISPNGSVAGSSPRAAGRLRTPRSEPSGASEHANGNRNRPAGRRARHRRIAPLALRARCALRRRPAHYDRMSSCRTH
jgi:hypothetical protein